MNISVIQEWFPFILVGLVAAALILLLAKFIHKAILYAITTFASLLCLVVLFASVKMVGGWEGMGVGLFTVAAYLGIIVGAIISVFVNKKS